jgi:CHAT domain-containing protein
MSHYVAAIEIHVCWPATANPRPATICVADRIHRRLGRWVGPGFVNPTPLDEDSGAGLPVLLGTPIDRLVASPGPPRIVIGVLGEEAFMCRDDSFDRAIRDGVVNAVVALDHRFAEQLADTGVVVENDIVDAMVPRVTAVLGGPARVSLFVHDPLGKRELADATWARINQRGLATFFARPPRIAADTLRAAGSAGMFVHVRRDAAASSYKHTHILVAKELRIPVVSVLCMTSGEAREAAYAGNGPAIVVSLEQTESIDRLIDEVTRAWLVHVHFQADAERVRRSIGLPVDTVLLSRPPELVDFANGVLPASSTLVLYPDPPLPADESALIRRQYPRARIVTPTTAHGQILARSARPYLDGMRIALSLSESPELPTFGGAVATWNGGHHPCGLTDRHYRDLVKHLTMCLIRSGAELAYGGHLRRGHTVTLNGLVAAHQHLERRTDDVLHVYLTKATERGEAADAINARFHMCATRVRDVSGDVKNALDLTAMREVMAQDSHARVILGGRSRAAPHRDGNWTEGLGYSGRFPGQAEEAWFTLAANKPLYVVGAFGGMAAIVGAALRGDDRFEPEDDFEGFAQFRKNVDSVRTAGPGSLQQMFEDFRKHAAVLNGKDRDAMWTNGLTVEENQVLFESTQPTEIAVLVMRGLLRVSRRVASDATLTVMLFHGSITDVGAVDAYVVPVVEGLPMGGADRALDVAMDGALARGRLAMPPGTFADPGRIEVLRVEGSRLAGDWVALISLGPHERVRAQAPDAFTLGASIAERAIEAGWSEIATVPMGGNLGEPIAERAGGFLRGIRSVAGGLIRTVVFCECDDEKYRQLAEACLAFAQSNPSVTLRTVPSQPISVQPAAVSTVLTVTQQGEQLRCVLTPPRGSTITSVHLGTIDGWVQERLSNAALTDAPGALDALRAALRRAVLGEDAGKQLAAWARTPIRVQHDEQTAAIPFELLLSVASEGRDDYFALDAGVSRSLQTALPAPVRWDVAGAPRVLLVVDPNENLPIAREEARFLQEDLAGRGAEILAPLVGPAATVEAVRAALPRIDVLHYAGHATPGGLRLYDGPLEPQAFENLGKHGPVLVVLNACQSGVVEQRSRTNEQTLAKAILQSGVRCFVGTGWRVPDGVGARFGRRFLRQVIDGSSVGVAFARTLHALRHQDFDLPYWFYYRLFGDPDLVCR